MPTKTARRATRGATKSKAAKTRAARRRPARDPETNGRPIIIMGHTLGAIAKGIGRSSSYLSRCHRGARRPSVETLEGIRVFLKLDTMDQAAALFAPKAVEQGAANAKAAEGAQSLPASSTGE